MTEVLFEAALLTPGSRWVPRGHKRSAVATIISVRGAWVTFRRKGATRLDEARVFLRAYAPAYYKCERAPLGAGPAKDAAMAAAPGGRIPAGK